MSEEVAAENLLNINKHILFAAFGKDGGRLTGPKIDDAKGARLIREYTNPGTMGGDPNWANTGKPKDVKPAMFAAQMNRTACLKEILSHESARKGINDTAGGGAAIHYAASKGHAECLTMLRDAGADKDVTDTNGETALEVARAKGQAECVKILEEWPVTKAAAAAEAASAAEATGGAGGAGAAVAPPPVPPSAADRAAASKLILFAAMGRGAGKVNGPKLDDAAGAAAIQEGIKAGGDPNWANTGKPTGVKAAMFAAQLNRTACLTELLRHESVRSGINDAAGGGAAIHFATRNGCMDALRMLRDVGADKTVKDKDGKTAYDVARQLGKDAAQELIDEHWDSAVPARVTKAEGGKHILYAAMGHADASADGAPLDDAAGVTAIRSAASRGGDVNWANETKLTPAMAASREDRPLCLAELLRLGAVATIDSSDFDVGTALHYAATKGSMACVKLLRDVGADREAVFYESGSTALDLAAENDHDEIAALLEEDEWPEKAEVAAGSDAEGYGLEMIFDAAYGHAGTAMAKISDEKGVEMIRQGLTLKGGDPGALFTRSGSTRTPAVMAAAMGRSLCLAELLKHASARESINAPTNDDEYTAAMMAARNGQAACLRLLRDAGADKSLKNKEGKTALDFATEKGHEECVRILNEWP